jgi:hydroxymethylbilane synthase
VVEGSCEVPLGGHATVMGTALVLEGFLGLPDGTKLVRERTEGEAADAAKLGRALGERILAQGGREVLTLLARLPQ